MLPENITAEVEVFRNPVSHRRQVLTEAHGHDVFRVTHENRAIAQSGLAFHMLDHLGVVIRGQERLVVTAIVHGHPPHEIRKPGDLRFFQLRVFMPVMIHVPGLVRDDEIVMLLLEHFLEHHEVGDQYFVHAANGLERVQVVFAGLGLDVVGFVGKYFAGRVNSLVIRIEKARHRVLGEPVDL